MNQKNLILIGGGGHCKSVIDVVESAGYNILGVVDMPEEVGKSVLDYKVIGTDDDILQYVDKINITEDETEAGEYYLDSIGELPEFRKMGIATKLIKAMRDKIFAEGHTKFGLIVDFDNPTAERLYTQIGFKRVGQRTFLGHKMWHLVNEQ
jgi:ribosomal protein S18 acetylase RimI-like enzyme